jgi:hypothetical protein
MGDGLSDTSGSVPGQRQPCPSGRENRDVKRFAAETESRCVVEQDANQTDRAPAVPRSSRATSLTTGQDPGDRVADRGQDPYDDSDARAFVPAPPWGEGRDEECDRGAPSRPATSKMDRQRDVTCHKRGESDDESNEDEPISGHCMVR